MAKAERRDRDGAASMPQRTAAGNGALHVLVAGLITRLEAVSLMRRAPAQCSPEEQARLVGMLTALRGLRETQDALAAAPEVDLALVEEVWPELAALLIASAARGNRRPAPPQSGRSSAGAASPASAPPTASSPVPAPTTTPSPTPVPSAAPAPRAAARPASSSRTAPTASPTAPVEIQRAAPADGAPEPAPPTAPQPARSRPTQDAAVPSPAQVAARSTGADAARDSGADGPVAAEPAVPAAQPRPTPAAGTASAGAGGRTTSGSGRDLRNAVLAVMRSDRRPWSGARIAARVQETDPLATREQVYDTLYRGADLFRKTSHGWELVSR